MGEDVADHRERRRRESYIFERDKILRDGRSRNVRHLMLVGISHDPGYAFQRGNFLRRSLRVASRDQNFCQRIFAPYAPDGRTRILVGGSGDGAGIQDNQFCLIRGSGLIQPFRGKLLLYGGAIRLRGAAAKVLHKKTGHSNIIAMQSSHSGGWQPSGLTTQEC